MNEPQTETQTESESAPSAVDGRASVPASLSEPTENEKLFAREAARSALHADIVAIKIRLDNISHAILSRDVDAIKTHWQNTVDRIDNLAKGITEHFA